MKTVLIMGVLLSLVFSSCTIIPNKYYHYEGEQLTKDERVILTSSINHKDLLAISERVANHLNTYELIPSKNFKLVSINDEPYLSNRNKPLEAFNHNFLIEIPSGVTSLGIENFDIDFLTKAGHTYTIFSMLTDGRTYTSNVTSTSYTQTTTWKIYFVIYDQTDDKVMMATKLGDVVDVE